MEVRHIKNIILMIMTVWLGLALALVYCHFLSVTQPQHGSTFCGRHNSVPFYYTFSSIFYGFVLLLALRFYDLN